MLDPIKILDDKQLEAYYSDDKDAIWAFHFLGDAMQHLGGMKREEREI